MPYDRDQDVEPAECLIRFTDRTHQPLVVAHVGGDHCRSDAMGARALRDRGCALRLLVDQRDVNAGAGEQQCAPFADAWPAPSTSAFLLNSPSRSSCSIGISPLRPAATHTNT
jgi:hypothetical protein